MEDIEGDLTERFESKLGERGPLLAKWRFIKDVLKLCRSGIIRPLTGIKKMNTLDILINHFSLTFRSLTKNKGFTFINFSGLTVAFLVCLFSLQFVFFELSYDNYHIHKDQVYRLVTDVETTTGIKLESSPIPLASESAEQFPEIQNYTRVFLDYLLVQSNEDNYQEEDIAYADKSLFNIFSFPLLRGNPKTVFDAPFNAVISESAALRYFGTIECIGEELTLDGKTPSFVTGVMEDISENSHLKVDIFLSLSSLIEIWNPKRATNWTAFGCYSYLLINPDSDVNKLNDRISHLMNEKTQLGEANYVTHLEPLTKVYLHGKPRGSRTGASVHGNVENIYIFIVIAILVLLVATFNFINISNSLYLHRAKEISMKKVLGVSQFQQQIQYLAEAVIFAIVCSFVAIGLSIVFAPHINDLAGKPIISDVLDHLPLYGAVFGLAIFMGILSGVFPAFILTRFKYDKLLKGNLKLSDNGVTIKNTMVIAQFMISIILIIAAVVVTKQLNFIQSKELGYSKSQKLIIDFHFDERINKNKEVIKQRLMQLADVTSVSISSSIPGKAGRKSMTELPTNDGEMVELYSDAYYVDYDFLNQYQIKVLAGRGFEEERPSDYRKSVILNESAVKELVYSNLEDVLGLSFIQAGRWQGEVIGVTKDFHYSSLQEKIAPLTLTVARAYYTFITLDLSTNNIQNTVDKVEDTWKEILPELPLSYSFADDSFNELYQSEQRFGQLTSYFAILAIALSLMGLLGLATLSANDRIKEMCIRKILGASPVQLFVLLSRNLLLLVVIALLIGVPVAMAASSFWLENFAYRFELNGWYFTPLILAILAITLVTIGSQVYKVAIDNPTEALKNE